MNASRVEEIWSSLVSNGFFKTYTYEAQRRYSKSLHYLSVDTDAWVLEVGCGTGRFHHLMRQIGFSKVISCDITLEHMARARELNPQGLFVVARGESLPFKSSVFNALVSNAAIEHFISPAIGIREFSRVTKRDSKLVVTSDCYIWRFLQILGLYRSQMPVDKAISFLKFKRLFAKAHLKIVNFDAWGITHYIRKINRFPLFQARLMKASTSDDFWANVHPSSRWINWLRMHFLDENLFSLVNEKPYDGCLAPCDFSWESILACPVCGSDVNGGVEVNSLVCVRCDTVYPIKDGIPVMISFE